MRGAINTAKVGDKLRCALPECTVTFTITTRRQLRKRYCCSNHKFQAWFRRNYKKVPQ